LSKLKNVVLISYLYCGGINTVTCATPCAFSGHAHQREHMLAGANTCRPPELLMNAACCVLRESKDSSASPSRSRITYSRRRTRAHAGGRARWKRI